jgi:hypothetical protein
MARKREDPGKRMPEPDVEGLRHLPPDEQELAAVAAEHNLDETTRREAIEQELMELGRSEEGEEIGE